MVQGVSQQLMACVVHVTGQHFMTLTCQPLVK